MVEITITLDEELAPFIPEIEEATGLSFPALVQLQAEGMLKSFVAGRVQAHMSGRYLDSDQAQKFRDLLASLKPEDVEALCRYLMAMLENYGAS